MVRQVRSDPVQARVETSTSTSTSKSTFQLEPMAKHLTERAERVRYRTYTEVERAPHEPVPTRPVAISTCRAKHTPRERSPHSTMSLQPG